jgi:hypothetical protein
MNLLVTEIVAVQALFIRKFPFPIWVSVTDSFDRSISNWVGTVSNKFSGLDGIAHRVGSKFHEGSGVSW